MKTSIHLTPVCHSCNGKGVIKTLVSLVLGSGLLAGQVALAADVNPCNDLLTLGLYNTTQSSDATQSRSLVTSQFCSADFSKITDNNYQYGKSTNASVLNIEASYGPVSGSVGSSSSGSNTSVISRDSIVQKQSELCTKGFNSQEYIKNTSDNAKMVYQGSLDAWNQCNNLNANGLKFKTTTSSNLQGITIDLSAMSTGSSLALTGVMQDGGKAICTTTLPPRNPNSRSGNVITVDDSTYVPFNNSSILSISCKREMIDDGLGGQSAEQTNLHFRTSAGSVTVPMAAIGKVPRVEYDKAVAEVKGLVTPINGTIAEIQTQMSTFKSALDSTSSTLKTQISGVESKVSTVTAPAACGGQNIAVFVQEDRDIYGTITALLSYRQIILNEGGAWQNNTFIVPCGGLYRLSATFLKDGYYNNGTSDDVIVFFKKNGEDSVVNRALAGEGVIRTLGVTEGILRLNAGDKIQTWVRSDGDRKWNVSNLSFMAYRIGN